MFEDRTFESIMEEMLERVDSRLDKREGSVIYDALAPAAAEISQLYADMEQMINQVFADSAEREYLIRRAAERGMAPKAASFAEVLGEFNLDAGLESRFSLGSVNFITTEKAEEKNGHYFYIMRCETAGSAGNVLGELVPIENISGLSYAKAVEIVIYGEDEEDTEDFRQRYFDSISNIAFGGNIADYRAKVSAIEGVGAVKVYRADDWLGAGTVGIVITTSENTVPSDALVKKVQEELDPKEYTGEGAGLAPIGHIVTVKAAGSVSINISCTVVSDGTNGSLENDINEAVGDYIEEINREWEESERTVVYGSRIIGRILGVRGIVDVRNVNINSSGDRYILPVDSIARLGNVSVEVE